MKILYASKTGNVQRFINKLKPFLPEYEYVKVERGMSIDEPFILITYTTGFGMMPIEVEELMLYHSDKVKAVVGSGNRNWGNKFCGGAVTASEKSNAPLLHLFELSGLDSDVETVANKIRELEREQVER